MKKIAVIYSVPELSWVGDGFPVRNLFSYHTIRSEFSPFLLMDYAAPYTFEPTDIPRGVGIHPHKGFETVSIVYQGEVEHRDSNGDGGVIQMGDIQWMTAGRGILHEEHHSKALTEKGGTLQLVQLWVNLPAQYKSVPSAYQAVSKSDIPVIELANGAGELRVIAGEYQKITSPISTFTPLSIWDIKLKAKSHIEFTIPAGWNTILLVLDGEVTINQDQRVSSVNTVLFENSGENFTLATDKEAMVMILLGEPINEPVVGYGPFVMNSMQEIKQAVEDFQNGRFGSLS